MRTLICFLMLAFASTALADDPAVGPPSVDQVSQAAAVSYYRISELPKALEVTALGIYAYKADFVKGVAKAVRKAPEIGGYQIESDPGVAVRMFVINVLDPFFSDIHSPWFETRVYHDFRIALNNHNKRQRVTRGLSDIPRSGPVIEVGLRMAKEGLASLKPFLTTETQREICEAAIGNLGRSLSTGNLNTLSLEPINGLLKTLSSQVRTQGLAITTRTILLYLVPTLEG